jgi:DNA-binding transcriptional LysR family regulator
LAIGAGPNIWDAYLQGHLQHLHVGLPGVALRTEVLPSTVMTRQLMDRTLDIAISFDPPKLDQFELVQLGQINLLLVSSMADTVVSGVAPGQYVKVDWGTAFNIIHAQEYATLPVPTLHTSSARIALDFILNNGGCAFLPEHLVQQLLRKGELHLVRGANAISRSVYVAYWAENDRLEQIQQAIDFLIDDGI